jgi:uncharacterized protein YndB with AHSA1/START domain
MEFEVSTQIKAKPQAVWAALTDGRMIQEWWDEGVVLEPRVGAFFQEPWQKGEGVYVFTTGKITDVVPGESIGLSWADEDWDFETHVTIGLREDSNGTEVAVRHAGWERAAAQDQARLMENHAGGWKSLLASLKQFLEQLT